MIGDGNCAVYSMVNALHPGLLIQPDRQLEKVEAKKIREQVAVHLATDPNQTGFAGFCHTIKDKKNDVEIIFNNYAEDFNYGRTDLSFEEYFETKLNTRTGNRKNLLQDQYDQAVQKKEMTSGMNFMQEIMTMKEK